MGKSPHDTPARTAWIEANRQKFNEYNRKYNQRIRQTVLENYGHACECCGETESKFLALDHVNGGGYQERKKLGGMQVYRKVINEGFPLTYQLLCHNCNMAKGLYGQCPHNLTEDTTPDPAVSATDPVREP